MRRQLLDALPDVGVVLVERRVAEEVGAHEPAGRAQLAPRALQKAGDGRQPGLPGVRLGVLGGAQPAVGGEPHVVELDLVEAARDRFLAERDVVGPDLLAEGVHPRQLLVVDPGLARAGVDDGQVGARVGQDVVLHRHDPGDRVDAAGLEVGHHPVEVPQRRRALGARGQRLLDLGLVDDPAAVALDVDDHRVELGTGREVQHASADAAVAEAEVGEIGGLDRLRLQHDLDGTAGGRHQDLLEARQLHEQHRLRRHLFELEHAVGVGANLDPANHDRRAGHRLAIVVEHLPRHRGRRPRELQ